MSTLNLDARALSRLLRSLEAAGLVDVEPIQADRRAPTARLSDGGWAELDHRFDEPAAFVLRRLGAHQDDRIGAAGASPRPSWSRRPGDQRGMS